MIIVGPSLDVRLALDREGGARPCAFNVLAV